MNDTDTMRPKRRIDPTGEWPNQRRSLRSRAALSIGLEPTVPILSIDCQSWQLRLAHSLTHSHSLTSSCLIMRLCVCLWAMYVYDRRAARASQRR